MAVQRFEAMQSALYWSRASSVALHIDSICGRCVALEAISIGIFKGVISVVCLQQQEHRTFS